MYVVKHEPHGTVVQTTVVGDLCAWTVHTAMTLGAGTLRLGRTIPVGGAGERRRPWRRAREHLHAHLLSLVHLRLCGARGCTGCLSRCLTHHQPRLLCCALRLGHRLLQQLSRCDTPRATPWVIYGYTDPDVCLPV